MNLRRSVTALFALVLTLSALFIAPATTLASATNCQSLLDVNQFVSAQNSSDTPNATAIQAAINPGDTAAGFQNCTGTDIIHGESAWISLQSESGGIVQAGIIDCHKPPDPVDEVCDDHPDTRQAFFAIGGCNGYNPHPRWIGTAGQPGVYTFSIRNDALYLRWDIKWSYNYAPLQHAIYVNWNDPAVACWSMGPKYATVTAERWDPGDGWGSQSDPIVYSDVLYQRGSATWYNMGGLACFTTVADGHCVGTATGYKYWDT